MTYYTQDLDSLSQICLKAFEGSDYKVRCAVAGLWGSLLSLSQTTIVAQAKGKVSTCYVYVGLMHDVHVHVLIFWP